VTTRLPISRRARDRTGVDSPAYARVRRPSLEAAPRFEHDAPVRPGLRQVLSILALGMGLTRVAAAEPVAKSAAASDPGAEERGRFRLHFIVPAWLPLFDVESSLEAKGSTTHVIETKSEVRWVAIGMLEAGYRPLIARGDVFGVGFGDQVLMQNGQPTSLTVESSGVIARGFVMYELGPWRLSRSRPRRMVLAPLVGGRYNSIALDVARQKELSTHYRWADPIVGVRNEFLLGDWRIGTHVDVGGFGVSSDLAYWAALNVEYMLTRWLSLWIGWQHYQVLFQRAASGGEQSLNFVLSGPSAGIGIHVF
jgi:hypothetical protein